MPRYFGRYSDFRRCLCMPSKITKLASSVVQMPIDYISVIEASYLYVHYKIQVSDYAPDHI